MFTFFALGFVLVFGVLSSLLVIRWKDRALDGLRLIEAKLLGGRGAGLEPSSGESRLFWLRIWVAIGLTIVASMGFRNGVVLRNEPESLVRAPICVLFGLGAGALIVGAAKALVTWLPLARMRRLLQDVGIRSLQVVAPESGNARLHASLPGRIKGSNRVSILDVTGFELIGKGPGTSGGILHDALATMTGVPVQVLLVEPGTAAPDPEERHATVFQTVLAELGISAQTFDRQVRATLDAIEALNEHRAPEARIQVAFHQERPTFQLILFDDGVLVAPWAGGATKEDVPYLDIGADSPITSLHEGFRRHFTRLWALALGRVKASGSRAVPKSVRLGAGAPAGSSSGSAATKPKSVRVPALAAAVAVAAASDPGTVLAPGSGKSPDVRRHVPEPVPA
jgi:hypothetical protein